MFGSQKQQQSFCSLVVISPCFKRHIFNVSLWSSELFWNTFVISAFWTVEDKKKEISNLRGFLAVSLALNTFNGNT